MITLKVRTQAKIETGKFDRAQTIRNILHEAVYNRRTARRKNTQARLTERSQFAMIKNMKMIAMNSGGHLFSQMKGNL